ncbi:LysR family transcriptional regulator [Paraburkholderia sp. MPAMCS5]|uniref:LysR family transcriptional regulator n=1 Tax=Paraburkholderia sp. MPAMCS5 TaxID=3112563 RepID=UPI002E18C5BB|nr:LysR family transcriptional regulator [Paraburkholderia sp. MPAMCS5]
MSKDRFDGLNEFVLSAQEGSFTAAGARLGLTSSAVGKAVTRLEGRIGAKLVHRTTRRLTLTNEGEAYLASCLRVLEDLDETESFLATGHQEPVGRVRIELPATFGRRHVLPSLLELSRRYPRLDISANFSERLVDLIAEGVDVAVRIGQLKDDADIAARRLGEQRLVICATPQYFKEHGKPKDKADLILNHDCIAGLQRSRRPAWLLRNNAGEFELTPVRARHEWGDGEAMLNAAVAGCGVAQLPTWLVGAHLRNGDLIEILKEWSGGEMPVHVIWPRTKYVQPRVRVVIDELIRLSNDVSSGFKP